MTGVHDSPSASERTVWIAGEPQECAEVQFAPDLSGVAGLRFSEWSAREEEPNFVVMRSRYRQPFGTFEGSPWRLLRWPRATA